jgi:hypothetical protein
LFVYINERKRKMNFKKTYAILLLLALAVSTFATLPMLSVKAQAATTMKTYAVVDAIPNPAAVGDEVLVKYGILTQLGTVDLYWTGLTVTVVYPDNTTHTLGPFKTDSTGSSYTTFIPDQVGTYKFTTNFPEQTNPVTFFNYEGGNMIFAGTIMKASTSETVELIVQQEPLPSYPGHALPTEYWSRPIDPQLREWYSISGNWLSRPDNSLALYNDDAPETGHVLWANPLTTGGLTGGLWGDGQIPASSEGGDAYEGKFPGSIAMNGILYYQQTDIGMPPSIIAVDLHTGQQWVFKNNTALSFGQILYFNSFNYDGVFTYVWSVKTTTNPDYTSNNTYIAYDPFTGLQMIKFNNVPSGTRYFGTSGEILILQFDFANKWMALWNSTMVGMQNSAPNSPSVGSWGSQVQGFTFDASTKASYSWNVSIPAGLNPSTSFFAPIVKILPDRVMSVIFNLTQVRTYALSLAPGSQGALLFDKTWAAPAEWLAGSNTIQYGTCTDYVKGGVFTVWDKELRTHYAFSTETGSYLWQTASEQWQDAYGWGNAEHTWYTAYGMLYSTGIGGILYAYDLSTGTISWNYTMSDAYNEPVTGDNWWGWIDLIADGKIYFGTLEHSAEQPIPRGAPYICVNATTGEEIWRVNGMFRETRWGGNGIIADSIIATMDTYDQRVYAIGKGPSALTIAASPKVSVQGSSVLVEGMITDISPGTEQYALTARFPNGVPAVSDESMSNWMLYVYKQFARPTNATGVPLTVDVLDANGNYRNIGTTTSDANGVYSFDWTPDIPGKYTVYVTFAGSGAYYASFAQSAFVVDAAPAATAAPTATPTSVADMYFVPAIAGLFVLIIIVAVVIILMLRKRP